MPAFIVPQDDSGRIVTFDVIESENHETVAQITEHPVEVGINITDHVRALPNRITFIAYVTNQPIGENPFTKRGVIESKKLEIPAWAVNLGVDDLTFEIPLEPTPGSLYRKGLAGLGSLFGPPEASATVLSFSEPFNAVAETYEVLTELQAAGVFLDVVIPGFGWGYESMVIERVAAPRNAGDSGVAFGIDMRQLRVVESGQVGAPPVPVDSVPGGKPLANKGGQGAKKPGDGEDPKKAGSIIYEQAKSAGVL